MEGCMGTLKTSKQKCNCFASNIHIVQYQFLCIVATDVKKVGIPISIADISPMSLFSCTVVEA